MTPNEVKTVNIGSAMRDGLQLKTVEIVALLHNACKQLDAGIVPALPSSADDLCVTDTGTVVMPRIARVTPPRATVALLLEALLPDAGEQHDDVPAALRSLPARLRDSGSGSEASDRNDLLTILRWHLPAESNEVLKDLVTRVRLTGTSRNQAPAIQLFAEERREATPAVVAATMPLAVPVAIPAATPVAIPAAMPPTAPPAAAIPSAVEADMPPAVRRSPRRALAVAATILLAIGAAGYAGYRFTVGDTDVIAAGTTPTEPLPGRVTRAETRPVAGEARPAPAATAAPIVESQPRPLDLDVSGGAFSPSFAAGGTTLLFHAGSNTTGRLFQASLDDRGRTSAVTPLLEERGRTYHARPSPDGIWVAFDSDRDGERGVYVASRNGLHVARVSGEGFAAVPSWSPDAKWLAFIRAEPTRPKVWNLWVRDVETGRLEQKSEFRSGQVWGASWFPDSRTLCYSHEDQLLITDTASGKTRMFESPLRGQLIRTPAVSPDGRRVVFQVYRDGVWVLDLTSGAMRRLLDDPTAEEFAWDPDGRQIAYHSRRDGQWRIWMLTI